MKKSKGACLGWHQINIALPYEVLAREYNKPNHAVKKRTATDSLSACRRLPLPIAESSGMGERIQLKLSHFVFTFKCKIELERLSEVTLSWLQHISEFPAHFASQL